MLKYLFDAQFDDGSCYTQNVDDRSIIDPEKRSCFYDVLQEVEKGKKLVLFTIASEDGAFSVDLRDGTFIVNFAHFKAHEEEDLTNFRLIYFRSHTHSFNMNNEELSHEIIFRLGWQANDSKGNNVQRVLEIE